MPSELKNLRAFCWNPLPKIAVNCILLRIIELVALAGQFSNSSLT